MLEITRSSAFKKEIKKINDETVFTELEVVVSLLVENKPLPKKYKLHSLFGKYKDYMECHLKPDVLLIFRTAKTELYLYRVGSHSNLFRK